MTAPEPSPTAEHIDAVAFVIESAWSDGDDATIAHAILTSTDPAVHEALAANLPADVMLAALVRAGVLTVDLMTLSDGYAGRLVTEWGAADLGGNAPEVAP